MIKGKKYTYIGGAWSPRSADEIANIAEGRTQTYAGYDKYHPRPGGYTKTVVLSSENHYTVWGRFQCKCGVLLNRNDPKVIKGWRLCHTCRTSGKVSDEIDWDRKSRTKKAQRSKSKVGRR
jgi:hypothetical protein